MVAASEPARPRKATKSKKNHPQNIEDMRNAMEYTTIKMQGQKHLFENLKDLADSPIIINRYLKLWDGCQTADAIYIEGQKKDPLKPKNIWLIQVF